MSGPPPPPTLCPATPARNARTSSSPSSPSPATSPSNLSGTSPSAIRYSAPPGPRTRSALGSPRAWRTATRPRTASTRAPTKPRTSSSPPWSPLPTVFSTPSFFASFGSSPASTTATWSPAKSARSPTRTPATTSSSSSAHASRPPPRTPPRCASWASQAQSTPPPALASSTTASRSLDQACRNKWGEEGTQSQCHRGEPLRRTERGTTTG
mmetsp:Transcript_17155/g.41301  ORF Transcript_17155/g.41301 Transcript_17155/m.41301 type:complete len:211 (+) Transcript_17155:530-1162(+)